MPVAPSKKTYYPLLDTLRGPAALLVFLGHWRNLLFQDFPDLEAPGIFLRGFYLITSVGFEAVIVFFVLSGCVIAHVISATYERGCWGWGSYLESRLTRLWIVLIPALILTVGWDALGMWLATGQPSIYAGTGYAHVVNIPVAESSSWWIFLGNMFFVQRIFVPTFGSNGPLWSISYEFVYYLVYPMLILALWPGKKLVRRLGWLVLGGVILVVAGNAIAGAFVIWLLGVAAYWFFRKVSCGAIVAGWGFVVSGGLLAGVLMTSKSGYHLPGVPWSFAIGMATACTVYFSLNARVSEGLERVIAPVRKLSDMSYSLYLLHTPLLVLVASLLFVSNDERWPPDGRHLVLAGLIAVGVFGYCAGVWYFTERRTPELRRWVRAESFKFVRGKGLFNH